MERFSIARLLGARELGAARNHPLAARLLLRKETMRDFKKHARILGHLAPVFCVKFDAGGQYILTGADDNLIKV